MKKGLVLEGGAMRGLFTAGVMDVFLENNIEFDGGVGVSAGAAFGVNYKSRQIGRVLRYNTKYCNYWKFCSFRSWLFTGDVYGKQFCYYDIPLIHDVFDFETYRTDVYTGKPVYHLMETCDKDDIEWMRASASMPAVSKPVWLGDSGYLDGGIADSVPLEFFQKKGYEKNVVILTQPEEYRKGKNKLLPFLRLKLINYPNMVHALATRHNRYNAQIAHINELGKKLPKEVLILKPKAPLNVGGIVREPERLISAYNAGREVGLENLERVKEFLKD